MTERSGSGRKSFEKKRLINVNTSLSSNSRLRLLPVCSGSATVASAFSKEKAANAFIISEREPLYATTASQVRS